MKKIVLSIFVVIAIFLLQSCEKTEGEGGTASIIGKVFVKDYNSEFTTLKAEYYAPDEEVFIVYGNDVVYNDNFKTHYDGTYLFEYLRKGKYTIFVYSKDSSGVSPSGIITVEKEVNITEEGQIVEIEDIIILK
ncbi:MAG: hypothetical protein U9R42_01340 [Bacteroidota bacterium]|nr:hypothetical protein [Bacteroidota bacterium]